MLIKPSKHVVLVACICVIFTLLITWNHSNDIQISEVVTLNKHWIGKFINISGTRREHGRSTTLLNSYLDNERNEQSHPDGLRSFYTKNSRHLNLGKYDRPHLLFVIAITSAPKRRDRRDAVRSSWLQSCHQSDYAVCFFYTDSLDEYNMSLPESDLKSIHQESERYGDTLISKLPGGMNFGIQKLAILDETARLYNYSFLLFLDDDQFVCFDKLSYELHHREPKRLYWGLMHCTKYAIWIDEAFLIITRDLVDEIALEKEKQKLMCAPRGGRTFGYWMLANLQSVVYYNDANRFINSLGNAQWALNNTNICRRYLAVHGVYAQDMPKLWSLTANVSVHPYKLPKAGFGCKQKTHPDTYWNDYVDDTLPKLCHEGFFHFPPWKGRGDKF